MNAKEKHDIPNYVFDMEYATQRRKEYLFLKECGILPSYVKENKQYNVRTYKYTKTPELFEKVAEFYRQEAPGKQKEKEVQIEDMKTMPMTEFIAGILGVKKRTAKIIT